MSTQQSRLFASVKRKFSALPDPPGFSISLTPSSYDRILQHFDITPSSELFELGSGKGFALVYYSLAGFKRCIGCDICGGSVERSKHVVRECQRDIRFAAGMQGTTFSIDLYDGLTRPIPPGTTHLQSIITWGDEQLQQLLTLLNQAPSVNVFATIATTRQQRLLKQTYGEDKVTVVPVKLESSGERRQVAVVKLA